MTKIEGCTFQGVVFDEKATESIHVIAKALLNLTEVFRAQGINIDCLLQVNDPPVKVPQKSIKSKSKNKKS